MADQPEVNKSASAVVKSDDDDDDKCWICLSDVKFQKIGLIQNCGHMFCLVCIVKWATYRNENPICPVCKRSFYFVTVRNSDDEDVKSYEESIFALVRAFKPYQKLKEAENEVDNDEEEEEAEEENELYYDNFRIKNRIWVPKYNKYVTSGRKAKPNGKNDFYNNSTTGGPKGATKTVGRRANRRLKREASNHHH